MSLKIFQTQNASEPDDEFIVLIAENDINLLGYAIVDRTFFIGGKISNKFRHIYEFPNIDVEDGDYIILYSGKGKYHNYVDKDGDKIHKLYWGADGCVWNDTGDIATLIKYEVVSRSKLGPIE